MVAMKVQPVEMGAVYVMIPIEDILIVNHVMILIVRTANAGKLKEFQDVNVMMVLSHHALIVRKDALKIKNVLKESVRQSVIAMRTAFAIGK
jgi:hypothetical protein